MPINLQGTEYLLYAEILDIAHEKGLLSITTELVQIPTKENGETAIVRAVVVMKGGGPTDRQTFTGYGDANPRNVNARIASAILRMAETRAKGRALRDATNRGETLAEELPDLGQTPDAGLKTPGNGHTAQVPVSKPAETWVNPASGEVYKVADLIHGVTTRLDEARKLGIKVQKYQLSLLPPEDLYAIGRELMEKIRDKQKKPQVVKEEKAEMAPGA